MGLKIGNGKEYFYKSDLTYLIYEGEYLNGQRNGKGKQYGENGELIYEGGYLNGQRNGNGKEYFLNGKLKFEGEYLNGKRNGNGKEYFFHGKVKFEGRYLNDIKISGIGYDINGGIIYKMFFFDGIRKKYNMNGEFKSEDKYSNLIGINIKKKRISLE